MNEITPYIFETADHRIVTDSVDLALVFKGDDHGEIRRDGHADVCRVIRKIIEELPELSNDGNLAVISYTDSRNRKQQKYELDAIATPVVIGRLTGRDASYWMLRYARAFEAMKNKLSRRSDPSNMTRLEILTMALDSEKRALAAEAAVGDLRPDAESMRLLRSSEGNLTMTQVSKMLEVKRPWLFQIMTEAGWFYWQNGAHLPYAQIMKQGLLAVEPRQSKVIARSSGAVQLVSTTLVTPKGLAKITEIVRSRLANDEKDVDENDALMHEHLNDEMRYGSD